jgi:serine protease inhibitor
MGQSAVSKDLLKANQTFAFELFAQMLQQEKGKNLMISPSSLSFALQMLYEGATGETREQMVKVLHLSSLKKLSKANQTLRKTLAKAMSSGRLDIANSVWVDHSAPVLPSYIHTLEHTYQAEVKTRNLQDSATLQQINDWVSEKTQGKIPTVVDPNQPLEPDTKMLLMNAVYLKGAWEESFDPIFTEKKDFWLADGTTKQVDTMFEIDLEPYYFGDDRMQVLFLLYANSSVGMYIILPRDAEDLDNILADLDVETWKDWSESLYCRSVVVQLPRFKIEGDYTLNATLSSLGLSKIFEMGDGFGGISDSPNAMLGVSGIRQKTFIEVNEEGTEATAVTVEQRMLGFPSVPDPIEFIADHPFFFAISDTSSGTILFMGVVHDPNP